MDYQSLADSVIEQCMRFELLNLQRARRRSGHSPLPTTRARLQPLHVRQSRQLPVEGSEGQVTCPARDLQRQAIREADAPVPTELAESGCHHVGILNGQRVMVEEHFDSQGDLPSPQLSAVNPAFRDMQGRRGSSSLARLTVTGRAPPESPLDANLSSAYARPMPKAKPPMQLERHVRLFRNGRNQAVRIPRELELPGTEAILRKEGNRLVIEPVARASLLDVLATLKPLTDKFPELRSPPAESVDL